MMKSVLVRSCFPPLLAEPRDLHHSTLSKKTVSTVTCSTSSSPSRSSAYIPKLEPFSRTKFERAVKEPPLIEKSENELADYCSTIEGGDESYSCWQAYFELKDLERESPKGEVEKLILQVGGVKSFIGCLHVIASMHKEKKNSFSLAESSLKLEKERLCPIPDGLPKSQDELEEEESARMPDSPFTRMLIRNKGTFPAWYSPAPDHETD